MQSVGEKRPKQTGQRPGGWSGARAIPASAQAICLHDVAGQRDRGHRAMRRKGVMTTAWLAFLLENGAQMRVV